MARAVRVQAKAVRSGCKPASATGIGRTYINPTNTTTEAMKMPAPNSGAIAGAGSGRSWRMARSTLTQRTAEPTEIAMDNNTTKAAAAVRSSGLIPGTAKASKAMPPARKASEVRVHARKVRSFAKVKRGSGSWPSGNTARVNLPLSSIPHTLTAGFTSVATPPAPRRSRRWPHSPPQAGPAR